jgi:hypothetical protein
MDEDEEQATQTEHGQVRQKSDIKSKNICCFFSEPSGFESLSV